MSVATATRVGACSFWRYHKETKMPQPDRYVSVKIECHSKHLHDICVEVDRQVPPDLRCEPNAGPGYSRGGGSGGCSIPFSDELKETTMRELRDNFQGSKRRGYVLIHQ